MQGGCDLVCSENHGEIGDGFFPLVTDYILLYRKDLRI